MWQKIKCFFGVHTYEYRERGFGHCHASGDTVYITEKICKYCNYSETWDR